MSISEVISQFAEQIERAKIDLELYDCLLRFQEQLHDSLESASPAGFPRAWVLYVLATDLLRYTIEDDYVRIPGDLLERARTTLRRLASSEELSSEHLVSALLTFRDIATHPPNVAERVEVTVPESPAVKFIARLAERKGPSIPVSREERLLVPILEESVSNPVYGPPLIEAFEAHLRAMLEKLNADALCFVEKTAGPVGALCMHAALVSRLAVPAYIYRDNYWVGRAKLSGSDVETHARRVLIVYDLIVTGNGLRQVVQGLRRFKIDAVGAMVLSGYEKRSTLGGMDVQVEALMWQDDWEDEISEAHRTRNDTKHISFGKPPGRRALPGNGEQTVSPRRGERMAPHRRIVWQPNLFFYQERSALAFKSKTDFRSALERLFHSDDLRGLPVNFVGNYTLIVPSTAIEFFQDLDFTVQGVARREDVTAADRTMLRHEQGHH